MALLLITPSESNTNSSSSVALSARKNGIIGSDAVPCLCLPSWRQQQQELITARYHYRHNGLVVLLPAVPPGISWRARITQPRTKNKNNKSENAALEYKQSRAEYKRRVRKLRHQYKNEHAWHRAKDLAEPAVAFASNTGGAANCSSGKERANCHRRHGNNCARSPRLQPLLQQWQRKSKQPPPARQRQLRRQQTLAPKLIEE